MATAAFFVVAEAVRTMTRRQVLIEMLKRYDEAQTTLWKGSGRGDDRVPVMPATWNGSYRELHRCLVLMRETRPRQYAHLHARYLDPEFRRVTVQVRNGKIRVPPHCELAAGQPVSKEKHADVRVLVWPVWVRLHVVELGLDWLVDEFRGVPYLPVEFVAA